MKITKVEINHFRALEDFVLSIEEDLSVIIGKNNTGKTSLLSILDRFLGESKSSFEFHDFNKKYLANKFPFNQEKTLSAEEYDPFYISLIMHIERNSTFKLPKRNLPSQSSQENRLFVGSNISALSIRTSLNTAVDLLTPL